MKCAVEGCDRKSRTKRMCDLHYRRMKRSGTTDPPPPPIKFCTYSGCDKPHEGRGFCKKHLDRLKIHGTPEGSEFNRDGHGRNPTWIINMVNSKIFMKSNECILWPYGTTKDGYGMVKYLGKGQHAHALALRLYAGDPPKKGLHAAHNCGNKLCVNPLHLQYKTPKENNDDKYRHGTILYGQKIWNSLLSESIVQRVREGYRNGRSVREMSAELKVHHTTLYKAISGENWGHVSSITND